MLAIVVTFFLIGLGFSTYLLFKKSISSYGFCLMLWSFFLISALTYRMDDIIGIKYKDMEITLRDIKREAYATISAVREAGKINLQLGADLATRMGYLGSDLKPEELKLYKDRIDAALDSLKVSETDKKETLKFFPKDLQE